MANALAAIAAARALGVSAKRAVAALAGFDSDPSHNPGRMNFFSLDTAAGAISVVMDLAHNEAGLEAMFEIMNGVRRPGARIMLGLGAVGDRQDELGAPYLTGQAALSIISRTSSGPAAFGFDPQRLGAAVTPATPLVEYPLAHPLAPQTTQNPL